MWPDPDRSDAAFIRLAARVYGDDRSPTETERVYLLAASHGLGRDETAELLGVSPETVKGGLERARRVLQAKTTAQAVARALRLGLIE